MLTRRRVLVLVLVLGVTCWAIYRQQTHHITNYKPSGKAIIAFGDSITVGFGVLQETSFVKVLERDLGVPIINAGMNGDTTVSALARFPQAVLERDPRVVIIELGGNDVLRRLSLDDAERNLDTMIREIHTKGAAVLLIGTDLPTGTAGLKGRIKRLAKKHNCAVIPNILSGIMGNRQYMVDRVHPNTEGHKLIAERIARKLRQEMSSVFPKR